MEKTIMKRMLLVKMLRWGVAVLCAVSSLPFCGLAQSGGQQKVLQDVIAGLKQLKTYSYHYEVNAVFPDGKKDQFKGDLYMDGANRCMLNKSDLAIILFTKQWFYRADHSTRAVSLFDLDRYYSKHKNAAKPEVFFEGNIATEFLDSLILPHGRLKSCELKGKTASVSLGFEDGMYLRGIELVYDLERRLPLSMKMTIFYDEGTSGTLKEITCSHYSTAIDPKVFDTAPYFHAGAGKAVLKQYKNYKLYATF